MVSQNSKYQKNKPHQLNKAFHKKVIQAFRNNHLDGIEGSTGYGRKFWKASLSSGAKRCRMMYPMAWNG